MTTIEFDNVTKQNTKNLFLMEYQKLCREYDLYINSCNGCCQGIFVADTKDPTNFLGDSIEGSFKRLEDNLS